MLTIGSMFSGIGGFELGLEKAGLGPVVWQCEINPYCRRVLSRHWPHAERFSSVQSIGSYHRRDVLCGVETLTKVERPIPYVDVICGGFPCQDISLAGKGAGITGDRSGLWRDFARIVEEAKPRFVAIENVRSLINRGLRDVLEDLASIGYDAIWFTLRAEHVGAPHRRERLFVIAWRTGEKLANCDSLRREAGSSPRVHAGRGDHTWPPLADDVDGWAAWKSQGGPQPGLCGSVDGVPGWVDRIGALGNSIVPQCAEVVGRVLVCLVSME